MDITELVSMIPGELVPLSSTTGSWALINLILAITGTVMMAGMLVFATARQNEHICEDETALLQSRRNIIWRALGFTIGIFAIILFFMFQDMRLPMALIDMWTIPHALIMVQQIVIAVMTINRTKENKTAKKPKATYRFEQMSL